MDTTTEDYPVETGGVGYERGRRVDRKRKVSDTDEVVASKKLKTKMSKGKNLTSKQNFTTKPTDNRIESFEGIS